MIPHNSECVLGPTFCKCLKKVFYVSSLYYDIHAGRVKWGDGYMGVSHSSACTTQVPFWNRRDNVAKWKSKMYSYNRKEMYDLAITSLM